MDQAAEHELTFAGAALRVPLGYATKLAVIAGPREEPDTGYRRNIVFSQEPVSTGLTAGQYVDVQLGLMRQHMEGFQLIQTENIVLSGHDCPLFEIRSIGPGGTLFAALIAICVRDGMAYNLSASHFAGAPFDQARADFLAVFQTLIIDSEGGR